MVAFAIPTVRDAYDGYVRAYTLFGVEVMRLNYAQGKVEPWETDYGAGLTAIGLFLLAEGVMGLGAAYVTFARDL